MRVMHILLLAQIELIQKLYTPYTYRSMFIHSVDRFAASKVRCFLVVAYKSGFILSPLPRSHPVVDLFSDGNSSVNENGFQFQNKRLMSSFQKEH